MSYGIIRPLARELEREYMRFGPSGHDGRFPCRRSRDRGIGGPRVDNQCAVRMSVALSRSRGLNILEYYTGDALHSAACCAAPNPYPHISSAQTLFRHLQRVLLFSFTEVTGGASAIAARKGIIFFDNVFERDDGTRGDHIDYWNGQTYMNNATGAGAPRGRLRMFDDAPHVWFCEL